MRKFEQKESHKHRLAKELLAFWLRESEIKSTFIKATKYKGDYPTLAQLLWSAGYGVFTNMPFYETFDPSYFEKSKGLRETRYTIGNNTETWFDPAVDRGKILFVADIVVFDKSMPGYIFEIKDSATVSKEKTEAIIKFFKMHYTELYIIEAEEILRYSDAPKKLKITPMR